MLKPYLKEKQTIVERWLEGVLTEIKSPKNLEDGVVYSVMNGGKRLRPILHLMTLELLGCDIEIGKGIACAIEMIHSFSLVHDDLPALDNDDYRRGKLTTHKKYGEAEGILIGDGLVIHAFYVAMAHTKASSDKIVEASQLIALYSGIGGMVSGQMLDIEGEGKKLSLEELQEIHQNKTGKLLKLPIETACIIANASEKEKEILCRYAEIIGLTFQIKDDILDIIGDFEKMGKTLGKDEAVEKSTYPSLLGLEKSQKILATLTQEAIEILEPFGNRANRFIELANYIADRDN